MGKNYQRLIKLTCGVVLISGVGTFAFFLVNSFLNNNSKSFSFLEKKQVYALPDKFRKYGSCPLTHKIVYTEENINLANYKLTYCMNKRGYRAYIKNLNSPQDIKIKNKNNFGNIVSSFNNFIKGKPDWKKEKNKRCSFYEFQKERDYCMEVYSPYTSYPELAQDNLNRETISRDLKEGLEFYEKAWQNYKDRNYKEALKYADKYLNIFPNDPLAINDRGQILRLGFKNSNDSIKDFTRAIEIVPNHRWAYINRSRSEIQLKNYSNAISDLNKHLKNYPNDLDAMKELKIAKKESEKRKNRAKFWSNLIYVIGEGMKGYNQGRYGSGSQPNFDHMNLQNQINSQKFHNNLNNHHNRAIQNFGRNQQGFNRYQYEQLNK